MSDYTATDKFAFSVEELSFLTTLSQPKIRKDIRTGKLKSTKKGSRRLILREEAIRYLNADEECPVTIDLSLSEHGER